MVALLIGALKGCCFLASFVFLSLACTHLSEPEDLDSPKRARLCALSSFIAFALGSLL